MRIRDSAPKFCSQSVPKFCTIHLTRRLDWRCPSFAVSFFLIYFNSPIRLAVPKFCSQLSSYILTRRLDWRCPSFAVSFPLIYFNSPIRLAAPKFCSQLSSYILTRRLDWRRPKIDSRRPIIARSHPHPYWRQLYKMLRDMV